MNLFFWTNNNKIDTFATEAANKLFGSANPELISECFNQSATKNNNKKRLGKANRVLDDLLKSINQFKILHSLGVYGKARFHLKFRSRLEELGYDPAIASKINK